MLYQLSYFRSYSAICKRAENETRTRDPNLGKVMLYQLSYFRSYSAICKRAENETRTHDPNLGKVMLYQLSYFRNYGAQNRTRTCMPLDTRT